MVPHRVGKLWFTGHQHFDSPEEGTQFGYRPLHVGPNPDPEKAELRDFVLEHASDPAEGFKQIFVNNFLFTMGDEPLPTDLNSEETQMLFMELVANSGQDGPEEAFSDIEVLKGGDLSLLPESDESTWLWWVMRYLYENQKSGVSKRFVSHLAMRVDAGHINLVRFIYPDLLNPEVGYRTLLRFLYEWHTSIRRVEAGEFPITPFEVAEEEDWGAFVAELDQAPVPPELFPS